MRLFKGQIEVKETDTIKVYQDYLTVSDENGNPTYFENSEFWVKREFDKNGNETYYENSDKYWVKCEFDENGKETYFEDSNGEFFDKRLKKITIEELTKMGYKLKEKYKMKEKNELIEKMETKINEAFDLFNEISDTFTDLMKQFAKDNQPKEKKTYRLMFAGLYNQTGTNEITADSLDDAISICKKNNGDYIKFYSCEEIK